jgi:hypothetical protein
MTKQSFVLAAVCLASAAMMAALPASAQNAQMNAPLSVHSTQKLTHITPSKLPPVTIIFNNFNSDPSNRYSEGGLLVLGATSPSFGDQQWVGTPFTLKTTKNASIIATGLQFYDLGDGATDTFQLSIYTDNAGIPGTQVAGTATEVTATNTFPTCCGFAEVTFPTVSLPAGNYWVVQATGANDSLSEGVACDINTTYSAYNVDDEWFQNLPEIPAAAVAF